MITQTTTTMNTELLNTWYEISTKLKDLKEQESLLRKEVIADAFPTHKDEGTENINLEDGFKLSAVFKQDYAFDKERDFSYDLESNAGDDLVALYEALMGAGEDGLAAAKELFKVAVTLNATAFKKLPPSLRHIVDPYVTIKEAATALKIVEPKEVK